MKFAMIQTGRHWQYPNKSIISMYLSGTYLFGTPKPSQSLSRFTQIFHIHKKKTILILKCYFIAQFYKKMNKLI